MSSEKPFHAYSFYYDLLYRDKDYAGEVRYVLSLLQRYGTGGTRLLEFGSGTGKHGILLAREGYDVTGIEQSETMLAQVGTAEGFRCQPGDIRTIQLGQHFDAVLALFHVVSYQISNEDVLAVFSTAADHLVAGGLFVLDVWYSPAVYSQKPSVRVKRLVDGNLELTRIAEPVLNPNANRVDVVYTLFVRDRATNRCETFKEVHPMRHFSLPELDLVARCTGFERLTAEEFMTGAAPSEETWGICLVLKKG